MNESSMATALEQRQQGESFQMMDAPNLPKSRIFPKRIQFSAGAVLSACFWDCWWRPCLNIEIPLVAQ